MAKVDVSVGGRSYQLACDDGQERHLAALAATVDAEVRALSRSMGAAGEARLLLMAALLIADKLQESQKGGAAAPADTAAIEAALGRLEKLAAASQAGLA